MRDVLENEGVLISINKEGKYSVRTKIVAIASNLYFHEAISWYEWAVKMGIGKMSKLEIAQKYPSWSRELGLPTSPSVRMYLSAA